MELHYKQKTHFYPADEYLLSLWRKHPSHILKNNADNTEIIEFLFKNTKKNI